MRTNRSFYWFTLKEIPSIKTICEEYCAVIIIKSCYLSIILFSKLNEIRNKLKKTVVQNKLN